MIGKTGTRSALMPEKSYGGYDDDDNRTEKSLARQNRDEGRGRWDDKRGEIKEVKEGRKRG
ncbi:MAG: hypothetical protein IPM38_09660 [Ignavibacteria bacterium]|nr:hypothetical protein [Ignavibacteria bacterium]